jgi:hypothetical protein
LLHPSSNIYPGTKSTGHHTIISIPALLLSREGCLIGSSEQEDDMERGLLAPLSPNEENALRRVAHGISKPKHLRDSSVERLKMLALVEEQNGRIRLTQLGAQRCADGTTGAKRTGDKNPGATA